MTPGMAAAAAAGTALEWRGTIAHQAFAVARKIHPAFWQRVDDALVALRRHRTAVERALGQVRLELDAAALVVPT